MPIFRLRLAVGCLILPFLAAAQNEESYNTNQRILRIRDLAKKNSSVLPTLAPYLADPDRDIRIEAVKAIVKIGSERSLEPLITATRDKDEDVQIRATDGIVNYYLPGYVARGGLTGAMTRGVRQMKSFFASRNDQRIAADVEIRSDAAQAIGDVVAHGASLTARANAGLAAGILLDQPAVPSLVQALHGKDDDLIFEALVALQKIGDRSAGPEVSFLAHDLDDRIQSAALDTLGLLRSTSSAPDVRAALGSARNIRMRRAALQALAMLGLPEDRPAFLRYVGDHDAELRSSALEGLGRIREPEDFPVLQKSFDEGEADWRIHLAAAFAMVNQGKVDTSEFSPLAYLVENLGAKTRSDSAVAYLRELVRREETVQALVKMIPEMDKSQKIALCSVLNEGRSPETIAMLQSLAKDIDPDIAFAASKALRAAQTRRAA